VLLWSLKVTEIAFGTSDFGTRYLSNRATYALSNWWETTHCKSTFSSYNQKYWKLCFGSFPFHPCNIWSAVYMQKHLRTTIIHFWAQKLCKDVHTHGYLDQCGTTRVNRYPKKHSPTHTNHGDQSSLISFLHLIRSMASSLFNLCAWQIFFHNLSASFLWSPAWPGTLHFILHTSLHPITVLPSQHTPIPSQPVLRVCMHTCLRV